jgi:SAM-dependent methyltransferase
MMTKLPQWFLDLVGLASSPEEGERVQIAGEEHVLDKGVLRSLAAHSASQEQTSDTFGFKWHKRDTFEGAVVDMATAWLKERYGDVVNADWFAEHGEAPILIDAGVGAGMSVKQLFGERLNRMRFIGCDVSTAVDVARDRLASAGMTEGVFIQADLQKIPVPEGSVDLIFSEGVLHHTDSTRTALTRVARHLKPGGRLLFYVYKKKGPIREFTDDYIRERLQTMSPQEAWDACMPLSKLGKVLGDLDIEIDVPEDIDLLEIPAGRINLQRLVYWHVFKAYYRPEMNLDEMNHINFDWYAPKNAHRQTPEEVMEWCRDLGMEIEDCNVQEAGITIRARKL